MRIIYVTACMPYGPAETFIIGEISELRRRNEVLVVPRSPGKLGQHAVWLASHTARESLLSPKVLAEAVRTLFRRPKKTAASLRMLLRSGSLKTVAGNLAVFPKGLWLARVAAEWKADHIHCHWAGTTATMAMTASSISGIPWSLTTHRSDIVSNNLLREKAESATMVRAIAGEGRKMLIARGVDPSEKLRVLPMGVHIPKTAPANIGDDNIVLCAADLLEVKGHRFLIEAWKILTDRGVRAQLWLAGSGPLDSQLRSLVEELGLGEAITFLGTLKHDELLELYRTSRISAVVLASVDLGGGCHEGIPVALVEAMSYGVPVIATNTGGIPELVKRGTGLLVPSENPEALADGIGRLLQDAILAQAIGHAGMRWVAKTRDIVYVAGELEKLFRPGRRGMPSGESQIGVSERAQIGATAATA